MNNLPAVMAIVGVPGVVVALAAVAISRIGRRVGHKRRWSIAAFSVVVPWAVGYVVLAGGILVGSSNVTDMAFFILALSLVLTPLILTGMALQLAYGRWPAGLARTLGEIF